MSVLLVHHRYRHTGGEERAVADLAWLIPSELGISAAVLERDSNRIGSRVAARGLLTGGVAPDQVAAAVHGTGATVVHAHNVHPTFGWRSLAAAKAAGARVVVHLHNYRLVCSVGVCFTRGADCTRCHGRNTLPGIRLNCRGGSRLESAAYGAGLALQQRRIAEHVDAWIVPSRFALERLRALGAPVDDGARVIPSVQRYFAERSVADSGRYALFAGRLTAEKGVQDSIDACARAGVPLKVAGDGPLRTRLRLSPTTELLGPVSPEDLAVLRRGAALAIVPSRYAEILPLAALEAMAAGLPTIAAATGGLREAVPDEALYPPGDVAALTERVRALFGDSRAGDRALQRARERYSPAAVAVQLREAYALPAGASAGVPR